MRHTFRFRRAPAGTLTPPAHNTCTKSPMHPCTLAPLAPSATSPRIHHLSLDGKPPKIYLTSATSQRRATLALLSSSLLLPFVFIPNNTRSSHCQQPQAPPSNPKASRALSYPFPPPPFETEFNLKPVNKKQRSTIPAAAPSSQKSSPTD